MGLLILFKILMKQFKYLLKFLIFIIAYTNSNELIKIDLVPKYSSPFLTFEYQIRTKYGYILYKDYTATDIIAEKKYYYKELSDMKNISALNIEELNKEYKKYDIYIFLPENNIITINTNGYFEKSFMLITEIFYKTGYINKKLLIIDQKYENVYFGDNEFINKNFTKFSFNEKDIATQIITPKETINISQTLNIFDIILFYDFDNLFQKICDFDYSKEGENSKIYMTVIIGNKKIKIKKLNSDEHFSEKFAYNFIFREYNLEKNELTFYSNSNSGDVIIEEKNEKTKLNEFKFNLIIIFIFCFIILNITFLVANRYKNKIKNTKNEYEEELDDVSNA